MRFRLSSGHPPLSAGDYAVLTLCGVVLVASTYWLFAVVSLRYTALVPAAGGTFEEGVVGTPRFINPIIAISDADRDLSELVYAGLMRRTPDGAMVPDLAASYTVSDDQKTYTFTLRDDITFHDGTSITADDVAFTVDLIQDPAVKSPKRANWEGVTVSVTDPKTITFTLKDPYALFIENTRLGIVPKHLFKDVRPEELPFSKLNTEPVGSGPYRFESMVTTSSGVPSEMRLRAYSGFYAPAHLTHLIFHFYGDTTALETAVSRSSALGAHSVSPTQASGQTVHEAVLGRVFGVFFNQNQNNLFASKAVRHALDEALDKKAIVSTIIGGYGSPVSGPLPPSLVEPRATTTPEGIDEAARILTADGWKKGTDGVWAKTVKKSTTRLSFTLATANAPELKKTAEFVAEAWQRLGVDVRVQYFDPSDLQQDVLRPRKYDALLFGEVVGSDADLFAFWDSSQRNDPGLNIALYTNSAVDTLVRAARTTDAPDERRAKALDAARIIANEYGAVFLYSPHFVYLTNSAVQGVTLGTIVTPADRFLSIRDWYTETERVWPLFK